ncbi:MULTISPECIES: shikimate kinase [Phyllobacteriaceae]|jgi:broad-specificity NMP kinase|uniref:Shikimate kinase n=1 Tax=Mesorhizobium hungaricum TaxID=1566387 RepID=A0A1C2DNT8_9HYPH|nr:MULTISPECIES: shikimate kinase [Mesorhizobium]MBN9233644.1 shikimate kinase [Mesorhizobium sp.]MDQ0328548.1 shikimate kinase [Mesorhizobium sp. YL-MeA3-2017]OCX16437.1 shikimate kinase [Mesorhizobium hungaricum]
MKRVLITGMSGTGKSATIGELSARGYAACDLDTPEWSHWIDAASDDTLTPGDGKDWVWQLDKVRALLSEPREGMLFISGCAENMGELFPLIDTVILLSAPIDTIMQRVSARMSSGYGGVAEERRKIAELIELIEPLLRESADHEIDSSGPLQATVDRILQVA